VPLGRKLRQPLEDGQLTLSRAAVAHLPRPLHPGGVYAERERGNSSHIR
jgi:hypothetical protein